MRRVLWLAVIGLGACAGTAPAPDGTYLIEVSSREGGPNALQQLSANRTAHGAAREAQFTEAAALRCPAGHRIVAWGAPVLHTSPFGARVTETHRIACAP